MSGTMRYRHTLDDDAVLTSRGGHVHRDKGLRTGCGQPIARSRVPVTALQAQVHKLPICAACYPSPNQRSKS